MPLLTQRVRENPAGLLLLTLGIALLLYHSTVAGLISQWTSSVYLQTSHGAVLAAVVAYLIVRRWREEGGRVQLRFTPSAWLLTALLSLGWFLAGIAYVQIGQDLALLAILMTVFWGMLGYREGTRVAWPLLLLLTAMELWKPVEPVIRGFTTSFAVTGLEVLDVPVLREGYGITVPEGTFFVDVSCSGLAQFTASLGITGIYAALERLRLPWALLTVALGAATAFVTNGIRVFLIVFVGHHVGMNHWFVTEHGWHGWILFGIAITVLLIVLSRFIPGDRSGPDVTHQSSGTPRHASVGSHALTKAGLALAAVSIAAGPVLAAAYEHRDHSVAAKPRSAPAELGRYRLSNALDKSWRPEFQSADAEILARYESATGDRVDVYLAHYRTQHQGKEAVYDGNRLFERAWRATGYGAYREVQVGEDRAYIRELVIRRPSGEQRLIWSWYVIGEVAEGRAVWAKLYGVLVTLLGDSSATAIAVSTDMSRGRAEAEVVLARFVRELGTLMPTAVASAE